MKLTDLVNISKVTSGELSEVGIITPEQLKETGSKEAFLRIRIKDSSACICKLYALEGAIRGIRWHNLPDDIKQDLKNFYNSL